MCVSLISGSGCTLRMKLQSSSVPYVSRDNLDSCITHHYPQYALYITLYPTYDVDQSYRHSVHLRTVSSVCARRTST